MIKCFNLLGMASLLDSSEDEWRDARRRANRVTGMYSGLAFPKPASEHGSYWDTTFDARSLSMEGVANRAEKRNLCAGGRISSSH